MQKIPGIGDIPILGLLFRSKAAQKNQTELVVMITPEILPNELARRDAEPAAHAGAVPAAAAESEEAGRRRRARLQRRSRRRRPPVAAARRRAESPSVARRAR